MRTLLATRDLVKYDIHLFSTKISKIVQGI